MYGVFELIYFFRWLFGYVEFSFRGGFVENFLSECFREGVELRDVRKAEDYITASCNLKAYKGLHRIALHNGGVTKAIHKGGLPFMLAPLRGRIGFFVGMLCFVAILSFLNTFIWNVEIVGNAQVSDSEIMSYLEKNNFKTGVMWSSVDKKRIAWDMMSEFDELSWVHINEIGTTAYVEVNERRQAPIPDTDKLQGKDVFKKELGTTVSREQRIICPKDSKKYYRIKFFTADIPFYFSRHTGESTVKSSEYLTIRDTVLPLGYEKYEEQTYTYQSRFLNDDELRELAKKRMEFVERDELEGFEIVSRAEDYRLDDTKCVALFSYIIRRK